MSGQHTPGPEGATDLKSLGIDHFHMDEWECTYNFDQLDLLEEEIGDSPEPWGMHKVHTLIAGPVLYAVRVPTEVDEHGDVHDYEVRLFASPDAARAAIAAATGGAA